jgi:prolipoprotein diacylglyceryl transferase
VLPSFASIVASIPSPSSGAIHIGSVQLRAYGLMIALGAVVAVWLGGRRLEQTHTGTREDMSAVAMWALPAGVIGARLYHVATDWKSFQGDWLRAFKIWEGGLGIWGGIALGTVVGLWAARRRGVSPGAMLRATTPALPLAQAIGRWGNWWNQELFGRPTTVPWALRIDEPNRPAVYRDDATFHPTFLYESIWNALLCVALIQIDKRFKLRPGKLFALYVAGYCSARFFLERLRVDPASEVAGLRINEWVSAVGFVVGVAYVVFGPKGSGDGDGDEAAEPLDVDDDADIVRADVGGDPAVTAALGAYAFDGGAALGGAPPAPRRPVDLGGDPEVSSALGKYAFDGLPDYVPPLKPEPKVEPKADPAAEVGDVLAEPDVDEVDAEPES